MPKQIIEVEIEFNDDPSKALTDVDFVSIKVPGQQACLLPKTAPAPRRLAKDLALAAALAAQGLGPKPSAEPSADREAIAREVAALEANEREGLDEALSSGGSYGPARGGT